MTLKTPAPVVEVRSVAADRITVELLAWTERPQRIPVILGELILEADRRLRKRGFIA